MKINEIFYSLQGEGRFTGHAATFVRFSGCNLRCPFCDTDHTTCREMTAGEIVARALKYPARHIILTGGEPAMQVNAALIDLLHAHGFYIQIETNGTLPLPAAIDWITCSPKADIHPTLLTRINELKLLYHGDNTDAPRIARFESLLQSADSTPAATSPLLYLQPIDTGDNARNTSIIHSLVAFIKSHPGWTLSLQTHKLIDIP